MKRKILIIVIILLLVISIIMCFKENLQDKTLSNTNNKNELENIIPVSEERLVMIDGTLYYDTGNESTITGRCGTFDGNITSNINENEEPTINNQANFSGSYGYQYIIEDII